MKMGVSPGVPSFFDAQRGARIAAAKGSRIMNFDPDIYAYTEATLFTPLADNGLSVFLQYGQHTNEKWRG